MAGTLDPGTAHERPAIDRPRVAHALGMAAAVILTALVTWLAWLGYRQPEFLIDLANAMTFC